MSDNIKVVVKVRPLISREIEEKLSYQWRVKNDTLHQIDQNGRDLGTCFTFDKVYDKDTDTSEVYNDVAKPIVEAAIAGFNGTIFAYGQTSSGKTYTMFGTEELPGIIPRAIVNLFDRIKRIPDRDFLVRVSYIEIYNETVKDLLSIEKKNVKIHDTVNGVKVDVTERVTASPEEVLEAMKEGEENRQTGATNMNEESSRSHSIFQITIESREHVEGEEEVGCVNVSQLNLVDLAGSERAGQTGATGLRFKEGTHINKSLSVLAMVIKQLSERGAQNPHKYINYRDSKLTRILQNSLGGNAKTSIICAVTPASVEETISTLQFANRAKAIENKPEVNAVATNASMIQTLTKQLSELQSQLEGKKNLEQDNANLQKQICNLQKLILNGFGQKSGIDLMSQSRRKMQQLRRVTISTLHPIIEAEDAVPKVPKFCTPGLKYNPLSLSTSDFVPIQNASKTSLAILPEEAGRMVTPPLQTGQKTIGEESIINLDDSDENSSICSEVKICSPYHKCFGQLKTPPCVLRKNAKEAEKNYKDIVQLTEREKMYTPNTVELLEKLEENINTIAKLEEEVNHLREQSNEKNTEIQELKAKIAQTGEEFKIVLDNNKKLEIQCNDLEVSYETLQKKSKSREDDLLLLLEEEKASKKADEIRKSVSRELNFMDMSKDISLVNSDTETSVTANAIDIESSSQINELVTELQTQLNSKIDIILKLESNLYAEKQRIESLESSVKKLNTMIDGFNSKVPRLETENSFLQSTIETLNATIEKQKVHLETANKDMESYNSTIQELQIKLSKKDSMHNVKVNDSLLETMITNEENILANNENMRNIVNTFKVVLDARNKEIDSLKSEIQNHSELESHNIFLKEDVEIKEKQINILTEQVEKLKDQLTENNDTINSLLENEKRICSKLVDAQNQSEILQKHNEETKLQANDLIQKNDELNDTVQELNTKLVDSQNQMKIQKVDSVTQIRDLEDSNLKLKHAVEELNTKLIDIQGQNDTLKTEIEEKVANINHLKEKNLQLANSVAEKEAFEKVIQAKHDVLTKEYDSVSQKINHLEQEINLKHDDVTAQNNENDKHTKEFLTKMKVILMNVKDVVFLLGNEFWEIPEHIDSFESVLNVLVDGMNNIRVTAKQLLEERDQAIDDINQIKKKLSALKDQYKTETLKLCENIEKLNKKNDEVEKLNEELLLQVTSLQENLSTIRNELKTEKQNVVILESQLNDTKDLIENLRNDLHSKDDISSFENEVESLNSEVLLLRQSNEDAKAEFQLLLGKQNDLQDVLKAKDQVISEIENKIEEIVSQKVNKAKQTTVAAVQHDILEQLLNVIRDSNAKIDACARCDDDDEGENIQKQIIFIVKQLSESIPHPVVKNKENESECQKADVLNKCECQNCVKEIVAQTKSDIEKLTEKNLQLMHEFAAIDRKNQELMSETHSKDSCNKDLLGTSELLANLKFELTAKSNEFLSMEKKASEWRDQFIDLQSAMQQQILQLQLENKQLSIRLLELNGESNEDFNKRNSPLSLATICARNIISVIQADCKSNSVSSAPSKSSIASLDAHTQVNICECSDMSQKLSTMMEDNMKLMSALKEQESVNKDLLNEREAVRKEIQLLIEPTNELQKKIVNHRTNLSTLTATTYAENSLLQSQLKVLKHHHTRYINVCQRDIPTFKTQLQELMMILKDNESFVDKNNTSFKRYSLPDVLDINASRANSKNESCLDGDVLMLDTNVTLAESTLICEDQTCLDFTQSNFDNDASYQVAETTKAIDLYAQIEWLKYDDKKLTENLQELKEENIKLRAQIESFSLNSDRSAHIPEGQTSHNTEVTGNHSSCSDGLLKSPADAKFPCQYSKSEATTHESQKILSEQIDKLTTDLKDMKSQRDEIEKKYTDLTLEVPSTEKLVQKLNALEKDNNAKIQDMTKLNNDLNKKNQLIKELQEENDLLSTQVMESISEVDDLKKELDSLKATYDQLMELQKTTESIHNSVKENSNYLQCESKDDITKSVELKVTDPLITLSICPSDSPGSRLNEISASQIELLDRKNICKKIIEDVASMAMDLDESMGDANMFSIGKDCEHVDKARDLVQQNSADLYAVERMECLKYCIEKTGEGKENFGCDVKLIDVLKSLYNNLVSKHNEEVENLVNKLRDFEDSKSLLQAHFDQVSAENEKLSKTLYSKNNESEPFEQVLASVRANIEIINRALNNTVDQDNDAKLVTMFKENVLAVLDTELKISTSNIFESLIVTIVDKGKINLEEIMEHYKGVKPHLESVEAKLAAAHDNLAQLKAQLVEREQENELLKAQNEKIREINRAVSLDIIHREQKMAHMIKTTYDQLVESNIIAPTDIDIAQPMDAIIAILIHKIKMLQENESSTHLHEENVSAEVNELKQTLTLKETELVSLRKKMLDTEKELMAHKTTNEDLNKIIERTVEDARMKFEQFQNQTESNISALKQTIVEKEQIISLWESKINSEYAGGDAASVEFVQRIEDLINENENLKSVNAMITKEKELASLELANANEIFNKNKVELDKLTADILVLRQTVNDNVSVIESMTLEAKALHEQNVMLKNKADEKAEECARLALNIKTHEKTAEIQTKIISRLHKQKEEDVEAVKSKDQRLDELTQKCLELQKSYDKTSDVIKASKDEIEGLKALKKNLEERVLQLETDLEEVQARRSVEATGDNSRRRRQSLHDSKRVFGEGKLECHDHSKMEAVFDARSKPDDLFMDVDGDSGQSNRSTPVRLSRGRDSLQRQDHSDRDEGPPSRPSSVMATRRRRQSTHDLHRSALRHTPSPHDQPRIQETVDTVAPLPEGEVGLRGRLAACQQELEDLKERYRELDDECETCAQYLRERDAQCVALKKEKSALEQKVTELNARLEADPNADRGQSKLQHCDAAVNTDEDWANLHAVVVDRMSFDAEVERNRRLTRTNEELRYKNQDLKNTLQRAMEKYASGRDDRELEMTKSELKACKEELEAARERCRELDEECETCAEYLRERDDQCRRLREAKAALEAKLQEYEQDVSSIAQSAKKKRQSAHDHNRSPAGDLADAATDTSDDLLSYQVERDSHARIAADMAQAQDVQRLRQALDKVIVEKTALEHRLMAIHPTMYVATGSAIVQSQQLADMVKENQKLKRMNAKLVQICKKRGKSHETHDNQENEAPASQV